MKPYGTWLHKEMTGNETKKKEERKRKKVAVVSFLMIMHKALRFLKLGSVHGNEV